MVSLTFQVIVMLVFAALGGFMLLFTPEAFWDMPSGLPAGHDLAVIRAWMLAFGIIYGLVWGVYWWLVLNIRDTGRRIPALPAHVAAAWLPLLAVVYFIDPVSHPEAMIPTSKAQITFELSLMMIAAILYPLYSFLMYRYLLIPGTRKGWKYGGGMIIGLLFMAGVIFLLPVIWGIVPQVYHGVEGFPTQ